jgi:hypothetical protein
MDFGQIIRRSASAASITMISALSAATAWGADEATVLSYDQRRATRASWSRGPENDSLEARRKIMGAPDDGLPLRISLRAQWTEQRNTRRHEAVVEYALTSFGTVGPASVKHSEYFDDLLITENLFRYTPFKKFGADAAIKFDAEPEPLKK